MPVRQMAAVREIHSQDLIAVLKRRHQHSHVRLSSGMRLNIRVLSSEHLFRPVDRGLFDNICEFASAVITLARITFGILVRKNRAHRLQHGFGNKILRCDQFQAVRLSANLVVDGVADQWIDVGIFDVKNPSVLI